MLQVYEGSILLPVRIASPLHQDSAGLRHHWHVNRVVTVGELDSGSTGLAYRQMD